MTTRSRLGTTLARAARNQQGAALVTALVLMLAMLTLTVALLSTGGDEVQVAANHLRSTQALLLAEAGLEVAYTTLRTTPTMIASAPASLTTLALTGSEVTGSGTFAVQYQKGGDANTVRIVATGTETGGGQRIIRTTMTTNFDPRIALLVENNLRLKEDMQVKGSCGSVHTNGDVDADINKKHGVHGALTATGKYDVHGKDSVGAGSGGNKPTRDIPAINPGDFLAQAQKDMGAGLISPSQIFEFKKDGKVLDGNGNELAKLKKDEGYNGFKFGPKSKDGGKSDKSWQIDSKTDYVPGVYYFEGDLHFHPKDKDAWNITLLTLDDIKIHGNADLSSFMKDVLAVAGGDLEINLPKEGVIGDLTDDASEDDTIQSVGLIAAHEDIRIGGNSTINGYIVSEGYDGKGANKLLKGKSEVKKKASITYNCGGINSRLTGTLRIGTWGL